MCSSDGAQGGTAPAREFDLSARAGDPLTSLAIFDGKFRSVARGTGRIQARVPPGIYKVQGRAGDTAVGCSLLLLPDGTARITGTEGTVRPSLAATGWSAALDFGALSFASAAPLAHTSTSHEYHMGPAAERSGKVDAALGKGAGLFLFVRGFTPRRRPQRSATAWQPHLAHGMSLRRAGGDLLLDLQGIAMPAATGPDPWWACSLQLDPGAYRLRWTSRDRPFERMLYAGGGWQTQLFLFAGADGAVDGGGGSLFMSRGPFQPDEQMLRFTELARTALSAPAVTLAASEESAMLGLKFENPMLGIFGGHLLARSPEPRRRDLLRIVIGNLRAMVGPHPDVEALAFAAGDPPLHRDVFRTPPVLQSSWSMITRAAAEDDGIVPEGCLAESVVDSVVGSLPFLSWAAPEQPAAAKPALEGLAFAPPLAGGIAPPPDLRELGRRAASAPRDPDPRRRFSHLERAILDLIQPGEDPREMLESLAPDGQTPGASEIARRLGLPLSAVRAALHKLGTKLPP